MRRALVFPIFVHSKMVELRRTEPPVPWAGHKVMCLVRIFSELKTDQQVVLRSLEAVPDGGFY